MSSKSTSLRSRNRLSSRPPATARSRFRTVLLCAALLGCAAAGCGAPAPELDAGTAKALQAQVLAVSEAAAADDLAGSLKLLDELGTELDQAAAGGDVSINRHHSIRSAIDAVRADLTALQAAAEAARVAAEQAAAAEAARVAAEQAVPPLSVAPVPAPADNGKNNSKDNGKGKGKD